MFNHFGQANSTGRQWFRIRSIAVEYVPINLINSTNAIEVDGPK